MSYSEKELREMGMVEGGVPERSEQLAAEAQVVEAGRLVARGHAHEGGLPTREQWTYARMSNHLKTGHGAAFAREDGVPDMDSMVLAHEVLHTEVVREPSLSDGGHDHDWETAKHWEHGAVVEHMVTAHGWQRNDLEGRLMERVRSLHIQAHGSGRGPVLSIPRGALREAQDREGIRSVSLLRDSERRVNLTVARGEWVRNREVILGLVGQMAEEGGLVLGGEKPFEVVEADPDKVVEDCSEGCTEDEHAADCEWMGEAIKLTWLAYEQPVSGVVPDSTKLVDGLRPVTRECSGECSEGHAYGESCALQGFTGLSGVVDKWRQVPTPSKSAVITLAPELAAVLDVADDYLRNISTKPTVNESNLEATVNSEPFAFQTREGEEIGLEEAVFQALGAASVCWDNLDGAGIFDSSRAREVGDKLMALISERFDQVWASASRSGREKAEWVSAPEILDMVVQYGEESVKAATTGSPKGREGARDKARELWDDIREALTRRTRPNQEGA